MNDFTKKKKNLRGTWGAQSETLKTPVRPTATLSLILDLVFLLHGLLSNILDDASSSRS